MSYDAVVLPLSGMPRKGLRAWRRSGRYRQVMFDGSKLLAILTRENLVVRRCSRRLAVGGRYRRWDSS